jgi:sterol desaturase/sphingolipid hydroxylase (fatty acid hydroxylase superfamily)
MPPLTWITSFLTAYLGQAITYFAIVGLVFLVTHRWLAARLARRRIHTRGRRIDRAQLGHEVRHSLVVLALGSAQALVLFELRDRGLIELGSWGLGGWGLAGATAALLGLIAFNDLWFYAVHRLLHTRWLYKRVHAVHHRSVDVNPLTSYSFHGIEALLITAWLIPVAWLVPLPLPLLMAAQGVGLANNVMAHLGYELLPSWWIRAPLLRWTNTATFHALHHERFKGNYGLFTRVWDRLFGTELDGYELAFTDAHRDPALSSATSPRDR